LKKGKYLALIIPFIALSIYVVLDIFGIKNRGLSILINFILSTCSYFWVHNDQRNLSYNFTTKQNVFLVLPVTSIFMLGWYIYKTRTIRNKKFYIKLVIYFFSLCVVLFLFSFLSYLYIELKKII
jgi:hypothetical protein